MINCIRAWPRCLPFGRYRGFFVDFEDVFGFFVDNGVAGVLVRERGMSTFPSHIGKRNADKD